MVRAAIVLALCMPFTAATGASALLLEKAIGSAYGLPENIVSTRCVIYDSGRMKITYQTAGLSSTREIALTLNASDLKAVINDAASGEISEEVYPADVPSEIYTAYQRRGKVPVLLLELKSDSGRKRVNKAQSATRLRNFMDVNCGIALPAPK